MKPKTIDEYLNGFPENQKKKLIELRNLVRSVLPDTEETLKWGAPAAVEKDGMILVVFSGHKQHMNFVVTPSAMQAFESELSGYVTGKGSIQLSYEKPLPIKLLKKLLIYRVKEYRENNVNWK
mgnify:CR=1 FL=1